MRLCQVWRWADGLPSNAGAGSDVESRGIIIDGGEGSRMISHELRQQVFSSPSQGQGGSEAGVA